MLTSIMKKIFTLFAIALMTAFAVHAADAPTAAKVKESMSTMKAEAAKLGSPKVDGENLYFGSTKINGDFTLVDAVKAKHGGTATFFVKKGNGFVRVSTNVMKDGNRAVGTPLDPNGPASAAIRQGNAYHGIVDILGKLFDTGYEPIKTAKGEIIGIYYVGYLME
ncbi:MAG: Cache 3/Cache 2 fusion domain-containing protein [Rhodocyclaceae bacterium]